MLDFDKISEDFSESNDDELEEVLDTMEEDSDDEIECCIDDDPEELEDDDNEEEDDTEEKAELAENFIHNIRKLLNEHQSVKGIPGNKLKFIDEGQTFVLTPLQLSEKLYNTFISESSVDDVLKLGDIEAAKKCVNTCKSINQIVSNDPDKYKCSWSNDEKMEVIDKQAGVTYNMVDLIKDNKTDTFNINANVDADVMAPSGVEGLLDRWKETFDINDGGIQSDMTINLMDSIIDSDNKPISEEVETDSKDFEKEFENFEKDIDVDFIDDEDSEPLNESEELFALSNGKVGIVEAVAIRQNLMKMKFFTEDEIMMMYKNNLISQDKITKFKEMTQISEAKAFKIFTLGFNNENLKVFSEVAIDNKDEEKEEEENPVRKNSRLKNKLEKIVN